ncbi:MAG: DUF2784 domain-containing protein [Planctomycetota bacterium]|jgi:hypothetical protein
MGYALLADLLVLTHLLFVGFVIGGLVAIVIGAFRGWGWVRNPLFRICHTAAIVFVALNALTGVLCPLTEWEYALRDRAGQVFESDISFMGRLVREVLFYEAPPWAFTTAYVLFALLVIATFVIVPPRWHAQRSRRSADRTPPSA